MADRDSTTGQPRTRRRTRLRRVVVWTAVYLLIGAAINVAVAWGISQTAGSVVYGPDSIPLMGSLQSGPDSWHIAYLEEWGKASIHSTRNPEGSQPRRLIEPADLPRWSRFRADVPPQGTAFTYIWEYVRGWPALSMYCRLEDDTTTFRENVYHAIDAPFRTRKPRAFQRRSVDVLPVGIIWPGFLVNTLLYAAIIAMPFAAFPWLRRRRRIRRKQCPACGYPLGASPVCTECGEPVKRMTGGVILAAIRGRAESTLE